ncbi:hypothetical protein GE09DRAFT_1072654 [Coniochaeta sp. 2T2.1]|nr:hypothetical protein GE09DRAFT_1072654 [Coniochaeta sp. 2T2.1]
MRFPDPGAAQVWPIRYTPGRHDASNGSPLDYALQPGLRRLSHWIHSNATTDYSTSPPVKPSTPCDSGQQPCETAEQDLSDFGCQQHLPLTTVRLPGSSPKKGQLRWCRRTIAKRSRPWAQKEYAATPQRSLTQHLAFQRCFGTHAPEVEIGSAPVQPEVLESPKWTASGSTLVHCTLDSRASSTRPASSTKLLGLFCCPLLGPQSDIPPRLQLAPSQRANCKSYRPIIKLRFSRTAAISPPSIGWRHNIPREEKKHRGSCLVRKALVKGTLRDERVVEQQEGEKSQANLATATLRARDRELRDGFQSWLQRRPDAACPGSPKIFGSRLRRS